MKSEPPDLQAIAVAAALEGCDPRSVRKLLRGEPVRGLAGCRAAAALRRLGVKPPK